ncbi:hypothetical protein R1flu_012624 [Riccia fluitans]|uniref:F-box associated beta-propeller type 1 domain-containing protein n=1 Tax=Riccia fluitans TaxID=41844 RepID=A0ABD1ZEI3_9MARC
MPITHSAITGGIMEAVEVEEQERKGVHFPSHLVEKIVFRIPFPSVFKARALSKKWNESFERMGMAVCKEWPAFCPAFFDTKNCLFLGYDRIRSDWLRMKLNPVQRTLKCFQKPTDSTSELRPSVPCEVDGVLLCEVDEIDSSVRIVNLLTGNTRSIPYPSNIRMEASKAGNCSFYSTVIIPVDEGDRYQVVLYGIVYYSKGHYNLERHMFDFDTMTWSSRSLAAYFDCYCKFCAYLDGQMFYTCSMFGVWDSVTLRIASVGFGNGHSTIFQREVPFAVERNAPNGVVRCGCRIIFFAISEEREVVVAHLYEVNKKSLRLSQLSLGRLQRFTTGASPNVFAHKNLIFFYGPSCLHSYDLELDAWNAHTVEFPGEYRRASDTVYPVAFEPGLNPFVIP